MAKTREKKEKDVLDQLLDNIDFRGLTQDEVVGKDAGSSTMNPAAPMLKSTCSSHAAKTVPSTMPIPV